MAISLRANKEELLYEIKRQERIIAALTDHLTDEGDTDILREIGVLSVNDGQIVARLSIPYHDLTEEEVGECIEQLQEEIQSVFNTKFIVNDPERSEQVRYLISDHVRLLEIYPEAL